MQWTGTDDISTARRIRKERPDPDGPASTTIRRASSQDTNGSHDAAVLECGFVLRAAGHAMRLF